MEKTSSPQRSAVRRPQARKVTLSLHTVEVEAVAQWEDDDRLIDLHQALAARSELLGPSLGADLRRRVIGVTVTVEAPDPATAHAIADNALAEELATLGFGRA